MWEKRKKDRMGQGGEDVHALWLNAALLAPNYLKQKNTYINLWKQHPWDQVLT